jgi:hypothetical protein
VPLDDDALGELLERVGIGLELNAAGPTLEPLIAAIIDQAPAAALRHAANEAVAALWDHELQAEQHRALTLGIAAAATLAADVDDEQAAKAIAQYVVIASHPKASRKRSDRAAATLARSLATDARRQNTRAALTELAAMSADEFPRASAALRDLLTEPVPNDPAEDDLWITVVVDLAEDQLATVLSVPPRG